MNELKSWWNEKMSETSPSMIFGLLQLLLGKRGRAINSSEQAQHYQSVAEATLAYEGGEEGEDAI